MDTIQEFEMHAARAFFASAWADQCDETGPGVVSGVEIMEVMPSEIDPAATHAAYTLRMDMERKNGKTVADMLAYIQETADGDRPATMEFFGHYAAMQAMGHGVGLHDAFGREVYEAVRVPYIEFSSMSLERDYF